jgi:hypothetical protein
MPRTLGLASARKTVRLIASQARALRCMLSLVIVGASAQAGVEVLAGVNLPMLVKLASVRTRPIAEAVRIAQDAGRKYIAVASSLLANKAVRQ